MVNGKMVHSFEKRREGTLAIGQRKKDRSAELKSTRPSPWVLYCPSVARYNGQSQSRRTLSMVAWSNATGSTSRGSRQRETGAAASAIARLEEQ